MHHVTDATVLIFLATVFVTLGRPGFAALTGGIGVLLMLR